MIENVTGIIIAGGKSKRIGKDKAFIHYNGKRLIEHSILLMQSICKEVIISANHPDYKSFGLRVISDNYKSIGPLGGLEASLSYSKTKHNLVIPCDTPFVGIGVFYDILNAVNDELAIVPIIKADKTEPLIAYYSKETLPFIHQQIKNKNYKIQTLFEKVKTRFIEFDNHDLFKNLNSPADFKNNLTTDKKCFPNFIFIAGDGRNVGKTFLACKIIKHLSSHCNVIGIKISPHFHVQEHSNSIICENNKFVIIDEKSISNKDSSLMLQSGAIKVFYIMSKQENIQEAFSVISSQLKTGVIVCESGGLHDIVQPGLFLFVKSKIETVQKHGLLKHSPVVVDSFNNNFDFDPQCIGFENNRVTINKLEIGKIE